MARDTRLGRDVAIKVLSEALGVTHQLPEALEYAHDRGTVHRDRKPANVTLRPDGVVKVLDFGLALQVSATHGNGDITQSPTITDRLTGAGVILGTAAYMPPEQARGRDADRGADIWAFGAVLIHRPPPAPAARCGVGTAGGCSSFWTGTPS